MPAFNYEALSLDGKKIKGSLIADDVNLASQELKSRSLIPIDVKERKASGSFLSFFEISYLIPFSVASSIKLFTLLSFLLNGRKSFLIF